MVSSSRISHSIWMSFSFIDFVQLSRSHLTSRRSQPPLARSVPLSRFTSQVGGGSAPNVRHRGHAPIYAPDLFLYSSHDARRDCGSSVTPGSFHRFESHPGAYEFVSRCVEFEFEPSRYFNRNGVAWMFSACRVGYWCIHICMSLIAMPNKSPEPMTPTHGGWQLDVSCGVMAQLRMLGIVATVYVFTQIIQIAGCL